MCAANVQAQHAAGYPVRPVRAIVPYAPGGGTDIMARGLAARLGEMWGRQVIVDNRGGGGTVIGTDMVHISYKGMSPALTDALGGQTQFIFASILTVVPHIKSGRLRALGVTSSRRSSVVPEVPTIAEAGVPGYSAISWAGLYTPAGVPRAILTKLNADVVAAVNSAEVKERLSGDGAEPVGGSAKELGDLVRTEIAKWAKVLKAANLRE